MCCSNRLWFVVFQFSDLAQENAALRSKLNSMKEYLSNAELETKASRETITRLVSDAEREQRVSTQVTMEIDKFRMVSAWQPSV